VERFDIVIAGAGMAGASLAAQLAGKAKVLMVEAEVRPGHHATGRSAAFWTESYGGPGIQPLTTASGPYLRNHGCLTTRGALTLANPGQESEVHEFAGRFARLGVRIELLDRPAIAAMVPGLKAGWQAAAYEPDCCDIDVAGLHQHYLALARGGGTELACRSALLQARREKAGWRVMLDGGRMVACDVLINAAGAWADDVAGRCGARRLGITPLRRTMVQLRTAPAAPASLPLVLDIGGTFYFKPEAGRLWLSPHDETPCLPCDAAPEEIDVAVAIERFAQVVDWQAQVVEHRWAGLRSFAPDRLPVYGFDAGTPGFFWCAGQGGFGIQTAPAASALAAGLLLGTQATEIDPAPYLATRFS